MPSGKPSQDVKERMKITKLYQFLPAGKKWCPNCNGRGYKLIGGNDFESHRDVTDCPLCVGTCIVSESDGSLKLLVEIK